MPYKVKNLMFSRRDPTRSGRPGHRSLDLKRGVVIGTRRVKVGRYLILSDEEYKSNQLAITSYMEAGAVEVTKLYETAQQQIHAPSPMPPAPPEPEKVEKKAPPVIEIELMGDDAPAEDSVVIMDMNEEASEPVKKAAPKAEPKKKAAAKKAEPKAKEAPEKKPAKRARRRKNED